MRKSKALLSLALIPFLIGCFNNKKKSSSESSTYSTSSIVEPSTTSSSVIKTFWTDQELKVFLDHLYGYVLPFYNIEGNQVIYSEEDKSIIVYGGNCVLSDLTNYTNLLKADGWYLLEFEKNFFVYEKKVNTKDGDRFLNAQVFAMNENSGDFNESGSGVFTVIMNDPHMYEWPTDTIDACMEELNDKTTTVIPKYEGATLYEVDFSNLDLGAFAIYCYTDDSDSIEDYRDILLNNRFEVSPTKDKDGYYEALSVDKQIILDFTYEENYKDLQIIVYNYNVYSTSWLTNELNEYVKLMTNNSGTTVPSYDDGYAYCLIDDYYYSYGYVVMFCYTEETNPDDKYAQILRNNGYSVTETKDETGSYAAISANEDLSIIFWFDEDYGDLQVRIYEYTPVVAEWPLEDLNEYLEIINPNNEVVIPSLDGAGEYIIDYDAITKEISLYCYGTSLDIANAYLIKLKDAGWTYKEDTEYVNKYYYFSPDGKITMEYIYDASAVGLFIYASEEPIVVPEWPAEEIYEIVGLEGEIPSPTTAGITSFDLTKNGEYYYVVCEIEAGKEREAVLDYYDLLDEMGFSFYETKAGVNYMSYPNKSYAVGAFSDASGRFIVSFYYFDREKDEGRGKDFEEKFTNWMEDCNLDIPMPDFKMIHIENIISNFEVCTNREEPTGIFFDCYFTPTNSSELRDLFIAIVNAFATAGYDVPTITNETTYTGFQDPNEEIDILIKIVNNTIFVEVCEVFDFSW